MMLILLLVVLSIISIGTSSSTFGYINTNTKSVRDKTISITFSVKQRYYYSIYIIQQQHINILIIKEISTS